jgi:hypothetical protein
VNAYSMDRICQIIGVSGLPVFGRYLLKERGRTLWTAGADPARHHPIGDRDAVARPCGRAIRCRPVAPCSGGAFNRCRDAIRWIC